MKASPSAIAAAYLAALLQGLTLVSFPASSVVLRSQHGISDAQYGLIFLPQVAAAIAGSIIGGNLAARLGLQRLLWMALLANALSQFGLASLAGLPDTLSLPVLLCSTAAMGLGFGLMGAPMNALPSLFFPQRASTALVVMHTLNGAGLMIGPLLLRGLIAGLSWLAFPLLLALFALALAVLAASARFGQTAGSEDKESTNEPPPLAAASFWILAITAVVYALAEGSFSNWAVVYLQEGKGLSATSASLGLSAFWGALVIGRLLISILVLYLPVRLIWRVLPAIMALAFALLPQVDSAATGIAAFALAGLGCSAFFPLTVSLATASFPKHLSWVSAMMIAALMCGTGLGSFLLGALHAHLSFERLYVLSIAYPVAALLLSLLFRPLRKPG